MVHEAIHAFDYCRADIDTSDCVQVACSEVRCFFSSHTMAYVPPDPCGEPVGPVLLVARGAARQLPSAPSAAALREKTRRARPAAAAPVPGQGAGCRGACLGALLQGQGALRDAALKKRQGDDDLGRGGGKRRGSLRGRPRFRLRDCNMLPDIYSNPPTLSLSLAVLVLPTLTLLFLKFPHRAHRFPSTLRWAPTSLPSKK